MPHGFSHFLSLAACFSFPGAWKISATLESPLHDPTKNSAQDLYAYFAGHPFLLSLECSIPCINTSREVRVNPL